MDATEALRRLVEQAEGTYGDYCEDVWGPRKGLRQAVADAYPHIGVTPCPACEGVGITPGVLSVECVVCDGDGRAPEQGG